MKTKLLALIVALQVAWALATIVTQETALRSGTVVHLETQPVDPRDLLRGDYVILNYKISTLPGSIFPEDFQTNRFTAALNGRDVYVLLEKRGEFHEAVSASLERASDDPQRPQLRGTIRYSQWGGNRTNDTMRVEYGLERYYVEEGTGNPRGKLTVDVSVPASGRGLIKQVYVDGVPYAEAMKGERRR
ncbi:MAG: GDYXXLXY domain-containing protein [Verrucomicrobiae bacterium]|nr:GDYXXLXY domain-containing protein [Verrucomicrobiae bacterium]